MKPISRFLSIILMCCLAFSLTACGTSAGTSSNTEAVEEEKEKEKVLTDEELENTALNAVIEELTKDNRGIQTF